MAYTCGFLLLVLLVPFSTGAGEVSDLLRGLDVYKNLTNGAVGLKQYAEHLSKVVHHLKQKVVHQLLDDNEKVVLDNLSSRIDFAIEYLGKAARGVTLIKEQSNLLLHMLNPSIPKPIQEILEMVTKYFSALWNNTKEDVKESEDGLRNASKDLRISQKELDILNQTLGKLKERNIEDKDTAQNMNIALMAVEAMGTVAVLGVFGTTLAPVTVPVGASLCAYQAWSIMSANAEFSQKQEKFNERIEEYETVSENTKVLREGLDTTVNEMQSIYAKFCSAKSVAEKDLEFPDPQLQFDTIRQIAEDLIKACETFL